MIASIAADDDDEDDDDEWKLYDVDDSNVVKINEQLELFKCQTDYVCYLPILHVVLMVWLAGWLLGVREVAQKPLHLMAVHAEKMGRYFYWEIYVCLSIGRPACGMD